MSLSAMTWAMKQAPIQKTKTAVRNRMVLTYLADRYNDDTKACWPSLDRIARELDTSKTTIQRSIKELEEQGLIRRTSPQIVAHIPEYRRPTVWALNLHMKREDMGSNVDTGGSNVDHPGVPTLEREGSNVDHLTQREPKEEPKGNQGAVAPAANADSPSKDSKTEEHPLPQNWQPDNNLWARMMKKHPQLNLHDELKKFRDYWHTRTDKQSRKKDWSRSWQNWLNKASSPPKYIPKWQQASDYGAQSLAQLQAEGKVNNDPLPF